MNNFENENLENNEQNLDQEIGTPKYYLDLIKKEIKNKKASAFIGSGFSKNANKNYPDWDQLLNELIENLYHDEFAILKTDEEKKEFKKTKIKKHGHLELVEKYIKDKGFREVIDVYIEKKFSSIELSILNLNIHKKFLQLNWNNVYTTNYDKLLEDANKEAKTSYITVEKAEELSIDTTKRIIKLHGSLRNEEQKKKKEYGFDHDKNAHYIISKSDYEKYIEKHSAFTHLMRIALLQETFCLIGFSGNDPNFLAWIEWVRDILKNRLKDNKNHKVFLIDVSKKKLPEEKELFYHNYGIVNISLSELFGDLSEPELIDKFLSSLIDLEMEDDTSIIDLSKCTDEKKLIDSSNSDIPIIDEISRVFYGLKNSLRGNITDIILTQNFKDTINYLKNRKNNFYVTPAKILLWSEQIISFLAFSIHKKFIDSEDDNVKLELLDILVTLIHYTNYTLDCLYSSDNIKDFEKFVLEPTLSS